MFENITPFSDASGAVSGAIAAGRKTQARAPGARAGDALRAIGWSELSARITAARDLRDDLRREASHASLSVASFADAAASYFTARDQGERVVNPDALEGRKASQPMIPGDEDEAARGDRETLND